MGLQDIEHFVVVLMENRSFDHMAGYLSLNDAGPTMPVEGFRDDPKWLKQFTNIYQGKPYPLHPLSPTDQNIDDPPHDMPDIRTQISVNTGGALPMGGFVQSYANASPYPHDLSAAMGYYKKNAVPTFDFFARNFTICDHWFSSLPSGTQVNRLMAMAGESRIDNNVSSIADFPDQPLVYDWLNANNIDWCTYQWAGFPFFCLMRAWRWKILFSLNDQTGTSNFRWYAKFDADWKAGGPIPKVIFIEPEYTDNPVVIDPNDDHCPTGIAKGQMFLANIYKTLISNPALWAKTLLIVTYDEHGGFFDHVPPLPVGCEAGGYPFRTTGIRVPGFLISPYVAPGAPCTKTLDHTSILRLLAERFTPGRDYSAAVASRQANFDPLSSVLTAAPSGAPTASIRDQPTLDQILAAHPHLQPTDATAKAFHEVTQELQTKHPEWLSTPLWRPVSQYLSTNATVAMALQPGAVA